MKYGRLVMLAAVAVVAVAVFVPLEIVAHETPPPRTEPVAPAPPVPPVTEVAPVPAAAPVPAVEPTPAEVPAFVSEPVPVAAEVSAPQTVEVSDAVAPLLIKFVPPEYPEEARSAGVGGTVIIKILVGREGVPIKARLLEGVEGHPELGEAALAVASQCRFEPATQKGQPVEAWVGLPYVFKAQ